MRTNSTLVAVENSHPNSPLSLIAGVRSLLEVLARSDHNPAVEDSRSATEEVLLDTEVDGCRYLLIRMRLPDHGAIRLSPREQEIVRMVAKGHPNKVIADVLNISSWTVCTHLRRIFAKLGVGSRAAMVARVLHIEALVPEQNTKAKTKRASNGLG